MLSKAHGAFGRMGWSGLILAICWAACPPAAVSQALPDDEASNQPGVRFTPGMARAFAGIYTRQVLKNRYQMPDDKMEQAQELVARRMMQMAHNIDEPGAELIERFLEEQLLNQSRGDAGRLMPPTFGKEFADRVLPIIPEINELVRGISQDVRPMLPMKQQLKMAGDLMAFKTAVDGFETTMKKWSSGEITDFRDPFRQEMEIKKDETGQTERLKHARSSARSQVETTRAKQWERYVKKFETLYGLDAAQTATVDSILREFTQREQTLLADAQLRERLYQGQLWSVMSWELDSVWMHPARSLLEDHVTLSRQAWDDLDVSFKTRLETIPTTSQRRAVEQKIAGLLQEKGLVLTEDQP